MNPDHLFELADRLTEIRRAGAPRQVDLRRAISSAYYGVFHGILRAAADEFAGQAGRGIPRYNLIYRKIEHKGLRKLCSEVNDESRSIQPYVPANGFDQGIKSFAAEFLQLHQKRNSADYDPAYRVRRGDAAAAVKLARSALTQFQGSEADQRVAFLTLLLFPPR